MWLAVKHWMAKLLQSDLYERKFVIVFLVHIEIKQVVLESFKALLVNPCGLRLGSLAPFLNFLEFVVDLNCSLVISEAWSDTRQAFIRDLI